MNSPTQHRFGVTLLIVSATWIPTTFIESAWGQSSSARNAPVASANGNSFTYKGSVFTVGPNTIVETQNGVKLAAATTFGGKIKSAGGNVQHIQDAMAWRANHPDGEVAETVAEPSGPLAVNTQDRGTPRAAPQAGTPEPPVFTPGADSYSYRVTFPNGALVEVTREGNLITERNLPSMSVANTTLSPAAQRAAALGIPVAGASAPTTAISLEYASGKKTVFDTLQAGAADHNRATRQAAPIGGGWRSAGMETRPGNPSGNRSFVQENGLTQRELVPAIIHEFSVEAYAAMQIAEEHGVKTVGKTAMETLSHERYAGGQTGTDNNGFHENK